MKITMIVLVICGLLLAACGKEAASPTSQPTSQPTVEPSPTETAALDLAGLIESLETQGVTVEEGDEVSQAFLNAPGKMIKVNEMDVQVFEYVDNVGVETDAATISPDGSSTNTTMITWVETPHFYKKDRLIVIYIGSDETIIKALEAVFGSQFAGR